MNKLFYISFIIPLIIGTSSVHPSSKAPKKSKRPIIVQYNTQEKPEDESEGTYRNSAEERLIVEGVKKLNQVLHLMDKKKFKQAFTLVKEVAISYNIPEACLLTGLMYKEGNGCEKNLFKAAHWLNQASKLGHTDAPDLVEEVIQEMYEQYGSEKSEPPAQMYT